MTRCAIHKSLFLLAALLLVITLTTGPAAAADVPKLSLGYVFTTHHTPLMVAAIKGEAFKEDGVYLKTLIPKKKYMLMSAEDQPLAELSLLVSKSGSETITLFAMNQMDMALASSTAFMSGVDKGTKVKALCPMHVDGMAMVFPADSEVNGYDAVAAAVNESKTPFKIGYHSPTSAPRVVFEGALHKAGFKITGDPNDATADILMVDLKSTSNLIPALLSKQVDCWVGPAPHPSVAEFKGVGHIALNSRDLPPEGDWHDFPCCVMGASESLIAERPEIVQAMTDLMTTSTRWSNSHRAEAAKISADWIGAPEEALAKSAIIYSTDPTEKWLNGEQMFIDMLRSMNKLKGNLKDTSPEETWSKLFDFTFVNNSLDR
ncbi:ABC transporter substrate-binding protein [Pseudodesulfovibrio profundus]|uniref:ABC transporter substrate-binding protein n=1 Tax=Pseudodesulfovibrio profundus TaxID=57320 RepID=A0A2C8FDZ7_9BACT|nr:CmpA/NrtA family ABC transporter substrate-binding protein [Pseudodesulfovibrio profundus]SOB60124.1 ABC transporter substrate-binding protein [Pseudodesulfovibrio profundus]